MFFPFLIFTELAVATDTNTYQPVKAISDLTYGTIWNELSLYETDFYSLPSFKPSLTSQQLLRHCKVSFI